MVDGPTAAPAATDLPAVVAVRTRVVDDAGREATVVEFDNGARLRYRAVDDAVREAWLPPDAEAATHEYDREADSPAALACRTVGEYLSFDRRARAEFVWGEANVATLLDD
jgi:hypothetical protein